MLKLLRRAVLLAVLAVVVASCGLDVIGLEPGKRSPQACVFDDDASTFDQTPTAATGPCFFAP